MSWTLSIAGGSDNTLEEHGFSGAVLSSSLTGEETLVLTAPRAVDASPLIEPFAKCVLSESGTVRFVGWLDQAPISAPGGTERATYTLSGAWRWLARKQFSAANKIDGAVTAAASGRMTLGASYESDEPVRVEVREQIVTVLDQARTASGNAFNYNALPTGLGAIEIPWEERVDDYCSDLLRALLSYIPTAVIWWTYSGNTPVLNFAETDGAAAAHTLEEDGKLSELPSLTPRYDLLSDTLKIVYLKQATAEGITVTQKTEDTVTSGGDAAELGANRAILLTFSLGDGESVPEPGLAARLAAWHQRLHVDAQAVYIETDFSRRVGQMWTFDGAFSAFSTRKSVCQQISRDLFLDRETITLGAPAVPSTYFLSKRARANNSQDDESTPGGDGGGGGGSETPQTGTLTIAITAPTDAPDFDAAECPWVAVGPKTYTGKGAGAVTVEAGNYAVQFLPVWQVSTGLTYISESNPTATVSAGGGDTATGSYDTVQRVFARANGQENETGIDINAQDIVDLAPPTSPDPESVLLKVRSLDVAHNGAPAKRLFICGAAYTEE